MRRSVAVIGFRNLPGHPEDNWLSAALAEMLNTELGADGALRIVSGEDVARARRDLPLSDEDSLARDTLERLRKNPGADIVVLGSYTLLPEKGEKRIRLDVRLQDTARGETMTEQAFVGDEDHLFELVSQAGAALRQSLGSTPVSGEVYAQARAALPTSPLAIRLYTEGKARLWTFDFIHARDLLIQAVAVEPDFPLAHAALADAWDHLGYSLKARDEAERALSLSHNLVQEEKLLIQAQYNYTFSDHAKTAAAYQKLFSLFPDNLDYGIRLADEQRFINVDDALRTLAILRRLPSPSGDDPRIDLVEARTWINRDGAKAQEAAKRGLQRAKTQGSPLLASRAYGILCQTQSGNLSISDILEYCEQARTSSKLTGQEDGFARNTNDLAGVYFIHGNTKRAQELFEEALKIFRTTGDIDGISTASSNLGDIYLAEGNLDEAARAISDAIPGYTEMEDKDGIALALNDLGEIARRRGDLDKALASYHQAKATAQQMDDERALAYVLSGVGDVFHDRGDLNEARDSYEQSLAIRKQSGEKQAVAETELALGLLALDAGEAADAETVIRKCKEQFHQDQESDDELAASTARIKALLAESRYSDALKEQGESLPLAARTGNEVLRLQFDSASARLGGASGHFDAARTKLEDVVHRAHAHKLLGIELESRLALAKLELRAGLKPQGRADLLAVEKDARAKGFGWIATDARNVPADIKPAAK